MAGTKPTQVRTSHNFLANLDALGEFLLTVDPEEAPRRLALLKREIDELIALLELHPAIGRPARFLSARSIQGHTRAAHVNHLAQTLGIKDLREYVFKDYVVLYAGSSDEVVFLAIKHQRQLQYRL
jgi:hypothetical protein